VTLPFFSFSFLQGLVDKRLCEMLLQELARPGDSNWPQALQVLSLCPGAGYIEKGSCFYPGQFPFLSFLAVFCLVFFYDDGGDNDDRTE
jgi:hypothetical protein